MGDIHGSVMPYAYFHGSQNCDPDRLRQSVENSRRAAQFRVNPTRDDVDSLIFLHRKVVLSRWLAELASGMTVLDVGGRIQPYRSLIELKTRTYISLDRQLEGIVDVVGDAARLPIASDSVDLVLCTDTLQYVPDAAAAVEEMRRVLRTGGTLLLSTRGAYPEHHDELWRFLPGGLRHLAHRFSSVETVSEGGTGSGLMIALNVLLHRNIKSPRLARMAARTTVPLCNSLGLALDRVARDDSRLTCGISMRAIK